MLYSLTQPQGPEKRVEVQNTVANQQVLAEANATSLL